MSLNQFRLTRIHANRNLRTQKLGPTIPYMEAPPVGVDRPAWVIQAESQLRVGQQTCDGYSNLYFFPDIELAN